MHIRHGRFGSTIVISYNAIVRYTKALLA